MANWRHTLPFAQHLAMWDQDESSLPGLCAGLADLLRRAPSRCLRNLAVDLELAGQAMDSEVVDCVLASIYDAADRDRIFLGVEA